MQTGCSFVAPSPIDPFLKAFYNPDVPVYAHDPVRGKQLFDDAGCPRGPDGVRFDVPHDVMPYGDTYTRRTGRAARSPGSARESPLPPCSRSHRPWRDWRR
ncbi:ABC-type transport system substrate-binding protein [Rhizobium sp. BK196]|uniref:hypothetical protein n=1 Tax=unclassified Rhizobium TaxID=2613769 RepID=UPI001807F80A|nr:hypothetical protein [Rhizobium sp. BK377]MBB3313334.1 ABC-type transport system substrate-binding protein [Rhizobium sp. BK196]MBB3464453.1 ABC-type transport system substrate-binding protein [Rhizobium sp. BK377]